MIAKNDLFSQNFDDGEQCLFSELLNVVIFTKQMLEKRTKQPTYRYNLSLQYTSNLGCFDNIYATQFSCNLADKHICPAFY